jgi:hypothetical protein
MAQYSFIVFLYRHFTYRANIEFSNTEQDTSGEIIQEGVSVCAGCHRILEECAVYELGKPWCTECYKILVIQQIQPCLQDHSSRQNWKNEPCGSLLYCFLDINQ